MAPIAEYRYLKSRAFGSSSAPKGNASGGNALEDDYGLEELRGRAVVRDTAQHRYLVFDSWDGYWEWAAEAPHEATAPCHDEVVFGAHPQRLKFDIDAVGNAVDAVPPAVAGRDLPATADREAKMDAIMNTIIDIILEEIYGEYFGVEAGVAATREDLVVMDSSGPVGGEYKFSYHVLVDTYAVADNEEAKGFTARVLDRLPAPVRALVDPAVNKTIQNFRLPGSTKPGSRRVKTVTRRFGTAAPPEAARLTVAPPPGARVLPRVYGAAEEGRPARPEFSGEAVQRVLEHPAVVRAAAAHTFALARGGLLLFRRQRPSHCDLCGRVHDHDNTLMLVIDAAGGDAADGATDVAADPDVPVPHRVVEHCRRAVARGGRRPPTRLLATVGLRRRDAPAKPPPPQVAQQQTGRAIARRVAQLRSGEIDPHGASWTRLEELPLRQKHVYAEPQMRAYERAGTLLVKAQMKLGKTRQLKDFLAREFPPGGLREPVVRIVTFRRTFSRSLHRDVFPDFSLYSDHKGVLDHVRFPRLIVQVESLHRLVLGEAPEPPDLVVLDEAESIFAQFDSGLHRDLPASFAMFHWLLRNAQTVVCMDANLGDRTADFLADVRPHAPPLFHWNQFRKAAGDVYRFTADRTLWLSHLFGRLDQGKRIVVPSNSLAEAETLEEILRRRYPAQRIRLYSGRTSEEEKAAHFADVHAAWSDVDILLYTPTVSAGVSFELEHFDCLFGYFTDRSCDVETCRQMLGRVRALADREHVLCLSGSPKNLPTAVEDIRRLLCDKRSNLYRGVESSAGIGTIHFEYAADGAVVYPDTPYFRLWLETARVRHLSQNAFVSRFIDQVADSGAEVHVLEDIARLDPERRNALAEERHGVREDLAAAEAAAVAGAPDYTPEEVETIRERLQAGDGAAVSAAERLGYAKFKLRDTYRWHGRELSPRFVSDYASPAASRVYKNLCRITSGATVVESLRTIQAQEAAAHRRLLEGVPDPTADAAAGTTAAASADLHRRYVFQAHFFAICLLQFCGFRCVTDRGLVREETLHAALLARTPWLERHLEAIAFEFRLSASRPRTVLGRGQTAAPKDFLRGVLNGLVNPVLRIMYGLEVRREPPRTGGKNFYLAQTPLGRLFVLQSPNEPPDEHRPTVCSRLRPLDVSDGIITNFLDTLFFDDLARRAEDGEM